MWLGSNVEKLKTGKTVWWKKFVKAHCYSSYGSRRKVHSHEFNMLCLPDFVDLRVNEVCEFLLTYPTYCAGNMLGHVPVAWLRDKEEGMFVIVVLFGT